MFARIALNIRLMALGLDNRCQESFKVRCLLNNVTTAASFQEFKKNRSNKEFFEGLMGLLESLAIHTAINRVDVTTKLIILSLARKMTIATNLNGTSMLSKLSHKCDWQLDPV